MKRGLEMQVLKITENFFENLKMNKYDFFNNLVNEIGNFAFLISEIYKSGEVKTSIIENYGYYISNESSLYIAELNEAKEIRVYYSYEELFYIFYLYYIKNMSDYSDFMFFIEQELYNYTQYTDNLKKYKIKFDLNDFLNRDKLRNFLIEYNKKENIYNYNFINFNRKYINYWDINILKKFYSFLLKEGKLKEILNKKEKKYTLPKTNLEKFIINILKNKIELEYKNIELEYHDSRGVVGFRYKEKLEKSDVALLKYKNINDLKEERFRNSRDEMNVEIISKEDFLKELQVIVTAYENIYNDNEVREMFEKYKQNI